MKATTGQTVIAFITSIRLKEAQRIIQSNPNILISDVATQVGFNTPKYFLKCFKKEFGILSRRSMLRNRKTSISIISRGNPLFFRTFPTTNKYQLPITILREMAFLPPFAQNKVTSLFCAKRDIFSIFAAEIILFSCKFRKTIILFSCKFHQTIILFSCKECIYQTYFREVYNEKENIR